MVARLMPLDASLIDPGQNGAGEDVTARLGCLHEERPIVLPIGDVDVDIASPVIINVELDRKIDQFREIFGDLLDINSDVISGITAKGEINRADPFVDAARALGLVMQHRLFEQGKQTGWPGGIIRPRFFSNFH